MLRITVDKSDTPTKQYNRKAAAYIISLFRLIYARTRVSACFPRENGHVRSIREIRRAL